MKITLLSFFALGIFASSCVQDSSQETFEASALQVSGPYFGFTGDSLPQLMMPGFISSPNPEENGSFSPDGREFVYCINYPGLGPRLVSTTLLADNTWSRPEIMSFSGAFGGVDPLFSPDGKRLYFTSFRPLDSASVVPKDADIWFVERNADGWGKPQNLGLPVNTETNQLYNSVASNGNIYFNARPKEGAPYRIYVAVHKDGGYQVEEIGGQLNMDGLFDPFVSPDEDFLIFIARREDSVGGSDLYISYRGAEGWGAPIHLPAPINSPYDEKMPSLTRDNKYLIFTSGRMQQSWESLPKNNLQAINLKIASSDNGLSNIYWVNTDVIEKFRPAAKHNAASATQ